MLMLPFTGLLELSGNMVSPVLLSVLLNRNIAFSFPVCIVKPQACFQNRTQQQSLCLWCNSLKAVYTYVYVYTYYVYTYYIYTFNGLYGPFSGTTRVGWYQKGKTNLDFTEARDNEWQWHQLGYVQVCTLLQTDNHASTPPLSFLQAGCPSYCPTNSVKALKALSSVLEDDILFF